MHLFLPEVGDGGEGGGEARKAEEAKGASARCRRVLECCCAVRVVGGRKWSTRYVCFF